MDNEESTETIEIGVKGLHCGGCVARLTRILEAQPGVAKAEVSLAAARATVAAAGATRESLVKVIEDAGFYAT